MDFILLQAILPPLLMALGLLADSHGRPASPLETVGGRHPSDEARLIHAHAQQLECSRYRADLGVRFEA